METLEYMMTATCGHGIDTEWFESTDGEIIIKDYDKVGDRVASYCVVCKNCLTMYRDIELEPSEVDPWLEGMLDYAI